MPQGAYHPRRTPDGQMVRKDGAPDGRARKCLNRDTPYYVRFNDEWFTRLEGLLDVPDNREAGTAIPGCTGRADLIETGFKAFLRIDELARAMNYRDVDELVTHMIEGFRFLQRQSAAPGWLNIEPPLPGLPPPQSSNP